MHGAHQSHPVLVGGGRGHVPGDGQCSVRVLHADGPEHGLRDWPVHIVQRRSVRAQVAEFTDIRPKRILLWRLLFRHHPVRCHHPVEENAPDHHHRAPRQFRGPFFGKFADLVVFVPFGRIFYFRCFRRPRTRPCGCCPRARRTKRDRSCGNSGGA